MNSTQVYWYQLGFTPGRETTDKLFFVRRMQMEYKDKKKKFYICFVDKVKCKICSKSSSKL